MAVRQVTPDKPFYGSRSGGVAPNSLYPSKARSPCPAAGKRPGSWTAAPRTRTAARPEPDYGAGKRLFVALFE